MDQQKADFLKNGYPKLLRKLSATQKGQWGKMNAQQMVEHMSYSFRVASGKLKEPASLTPEQTEKSHAFMMTEKPFRENTPNQLLPAEPEPLKNKSMEEAVQELEKEISDFFSAYVSQLGLRVLNPFFGNLDLGEQVHLMHKHATHHLRQFGLAG